MNDIVDTLQEFAERLYLELVRMDAETRHEFREQIKEAMLPTKIDNEMSEWAAWARNKEAVARAVARGPVVA